MIKESFLKSQINKAKKERKTPSFVKRLVLLSLDDALAAHYSNERSMKCLQSSLALVALLEKFNIKATIWSGLYAFQKYQKIRPSPPVGMAFGVMTIMFFAAPSSGNLLI